MLWIHSRYNLKKILLFNERDCNVLCLEIRKHGNNSHFSKLVAEYHSNKTHSFEKFKCSYSECIKRCLRKSAISPMFNEVCKLQSISLTNAFIYTRLKAYIQDYPQFCWKAWNWSFSAICIPHIQTHISTNKIMFKERKRLEVLASFITFTAIWLCLLKVFIKLFYSKL